MQGSSIPEIDMASVSLKTNDDGSFNLHAGATDLGTGSDTVLAQIAAEVLGIEVDDVLVTSSDTDLTPFDVGAYASSTTYLSGEAARRAALDVAGQVKQVAADMLETAPEGLELRDSRAVAPGGASVTLAEVALHKLFNTLDLPALQTILVPTYEESGPYGAKSVSEICINGPCPAIASAVFDAVDVRLRETPFTAERVLAALEARGR